MPSRPSADGARKDQKQHIEETNTGVSSAW